MSDQYIYSTDAKKGYGFNGVKGDRFATVAGWEQGTAGFAGNVYSRLASENGMAELFKQIDTQKFTDEILGIYPWSTPDYHRSFWSLSVPFGGTGADKNEPVNYKFFYHSPKVLI